MAEAPERREFESSKKLRGVMGNYYTELMKGPEEGKKTAWCTSVGPAELLRAMGFNVYFPENHGAMLGSTRMAPDLIPLANARGFSPDICSYLTSDIGSYLKGESPFQKLKLPGPPKADVLVFNTNQCRDVKDWFQFYAREWSIPCIGIHTARSIGRLSDSLVDDVAKQIEDLVEPLEAVIGEKLDPERLKEVIALSRKCTLLWKEVLETASSTPAPITFFDDTIQMGPAVVLRGTQEAVDYYEGLLAELKERVASGVAAINGERHRIYWEGMPIWGKLKNLSMQFLDLKTCVVASTYCNSWIFEDLDPSDPFRSMARAYSNLFICRSEDRKEEYMEEMISKYKVDGVLYHDAKTCPNNSNNRYQMPQRLQGKTGKPYLVINGDLNDLRLYSEEQTRTNIEAFVEQLFGGVGDHTWRKTSEAMQYFCGIDIGASAAKLVIIDETRQTVSTSVRRSGVDYSRTADLCLADALSSAHLEKDQIVRSTSTGYGRDNVPWTDGTMTEIACHGKGAWFHFPQRITVLDIGAQDSKVIHLDEEGHRTSFRMNRKCAAGTGAFLEEIAHRLDLSISDLNDLARRSNKDVTLGSFCTVFAATEILERIRAGEKAEDIVKGAFRSVVKRILEMDTIDGTLVITGGVVAHNSLLATLVEESFGAKALVPPDPQYIGAFGAALFALEKERSHADQ